MLPINTTDRQTNKQATNTHTQKQKNPPKNPQPNLCLGGDNSLAIITQAQSFS